MNSIDEPALASPDPDPDSGPDAPLPDRIRHLVEGESFAVLCTQGGEQPYGSVIAFAVSDDLCGVAFCTSRNTRKYRLLDSCRQVALVIDDRGKHGDDTRQVSAVTVTGRATELEAGERRDRWHDRLLARHGYLKEFLASPTSSIFLVDIVRYLHVARFQEVSQWIPTPGA